MNIEISVIIPCYNHGKYVREAIQSVQNSSVADKCEIIVVNDGSTDFCTFQVMAELENEGIKVINQHNQGLAKTRNNGIKIAKGKYILPLDADNTISPNFIENALDILEKNPETSIVYTDRELFGDKKGIEIVGRFDLKKMIYMNYIDACAIYRKLVWEKIGGYDEHMPVMGWEDWDFWLCSTEYNYKFHYIPESLFQYRVLENSMIQKLHKSEKFQMLIEYMSIKHAKIIYESYCHIYNEYSISMFEKRHPLRTSLKFLYQWIIKK